MHTSFENRALTPVNKLGLTALALLSGIITTASANPVIYKGAEPAKGKKLVLIASDHEYRSEETLPALARILAKHHGFDCTVLFGLNDKGEIEAGSSNVPGMEALADADGLVFFARFLAPKPEQMKHLDAYLNRGGPVLGLRTSTHAFNYRDKNDPYYKYHFRYNEEDYKNGFGHQVLGQTWVGHYGRNHQQSTRITIVPEQAGNPILRGVKDVHIHAGAYNAIPADDWTILTMAQPLMSMKQDGEPDKSKAPKASEWTRKYKGKDGKEGRVFTSLYGASEDILNDGYRRMIINGVYWSLGLEAQIKADSTIDFVGLYKPNTFRFRGEAKGVKPAMYNGYESQVPANNNTAAPAKKQKPKPKKKAKPKVKLPKPDSIDAGANGAKGDKGKAVKGKGKKERKPARFVRVELSGNKRILTINEIEIFSGGKNIARGKLSKQSSVASGGSPERAIDGNKNGDYRKSGQSHTSSEKDPWWEVDLEKAVVIDHIEIWNRNSLQERLDNFVVKGLDDEREEVFKYGPHKAPGTSIKIDLAKNGKVTKKGKRSRGGSSSSAPSKPLIAVPEEYRDPTPFAFQKGDSIAIIGNGLADRMQHDGWMETALQSAFPGLELSFRNMSLNGDQVDKFPRSRGFVNFEDYLRHVKADVIFAFFGYNESFAGAEKASDYENKLVALVARLRGTQPNGKTFPRIVLFSPIAHENLENPALPDGRANNGRLSAYMQATRRAAKKAGVAFLDLFSPTIHFYHHCQEPLTINGIHLNREGNRRLAEVIASSLAGKDVTADAKLNMLHEAVLDKNWHWHNRYRATDGNDVWGGRSGLSFVDGQNNRTVLQHELLMLDDMTANRDKAIWARANGKSLEVNDANVKPAVAVKSNVGGKSRSSNAMKEGNVKYQSGEDALKYLDVRDGFEISLFADEKNFPGLVNPVQMQVDTRGRLWAAAWVTYPKWEPLKEMNDALLIFPDENRDGKADRVIEFARVHNPLGFEFWNGGVLVTSMPDLLYLKDTDGDDKADVRYSILQGIGSSDTHHAANNLIYGPDGGLYWQSGIFMIHNHEHPWGPSLTTGASGMYRFDPRRYTIAFHAGNSPNPHGISFDYWGYHYATDGTGGRAYQVRPQGSGFKMQGLLKKQVRPVPANEVVSSAHFPDEFQGDFLICNAIGFLGIKQYKLARNSETGAVWGEPNGGKLKVKKLLPDGTTVDVESDGLMMSGDKNFRPTDAVFGADGALYVSDWQNVIIGHMQHNVRDPNRDHKHGRIYRITSTGRPLQENVAIDGQPIPALLENLKHPIDGVRHRTRVELSERDSKEVIAATKKWMAQFDPEDEEDAHHLLEALWLHQQHGVRDLKLLNVLLKSPQPHAVIAAKTVEHHWTVADPTKGGGSVEASKTVAKKKSGIISDKPELTEIRIATVMEKMTYDTKNLTVKAGKKIRLTFANPDYMPHNMVLVNPGTADAVAEKAIALGAAGFKVGFVPKSDDIIWSSKLLDHGNEQVIEFTAPAKPGDYPYVCTFPGHHLLMRGVLHVK
jgi:putative membrane-bound dehydrogenase-like protein